MSENKCPHCNSTLFEMITINGMKCPLCDYRAIKPPQPPVKVNNNLQEKVDILQAKLSILEHLQRMDDKQIVLLIKTAQSQEIEILKLKKICINLVQLINSKSKKDENNETNDTTD